MEQIICPIDKNIFAHFARQIFPLIIRDVKQPNMINKQICNLVLDTDHHFDFSLNSKSLTPEKDAPL